MVDLNELTSSLKETILFIIFGDFTTVFQRFCTFLIIVLHHQMGKYIYRKLPEITVNLFTDFVIIFTELLPNFYRKKTVNLSVIGGKFTGIFYHKLLKFLPFFLLSFSKNLLTFLPNFFGSTAFR